MHSNYRLAFGQWSTIFSSKKYRGHLLTFKSLNLRYINLVDIRLTRNRDSRPEYISVKEADLMYRRESLPLILQEAFSHELSRRLVFS